MPNGKPESIVTPGPDRVSKEANQGSHKPYMWSYSCLGSQNRNSWPRAVFNEATHCVLLHNLSSFTLV